MRKLFWAMVIVFVFPLASYSQDARALYDALHQGQADVAKEQKSLAILKETEGLINKAVETYKDELRKNNEEWTRIKMDTDQWKAEDASYKKALDSFKSRDADFQTQWQNFRSKWDANQGDIARHNSWKPDPRNAGAVNSYNAEAERLNSIKQGLVPEKERLQQQDRNLQTESENLKTRWEKKEATRQALLKRIDSADRKAKDLEWSKGEITKQTEKWAKDWKETTARLNDAIARVNSILKNIAQISECKGTFPLEVDTTNLNGAAEQAKRCIDMHFDNSGRGDTSPVKPKPPFKARRR